MRRHVEIGARRDDQRVVAAEFQYVSPEPSVNRFGDIESHIGRPCSRDERNARIIRQFFADVFRSPTRRVKIAGSAPVSRQTCSAILVTAIAVSGVFSDGFQIVASPHTAASAAFHDHTATGKLNAVNDCDDAKRMPLFHQTVIRPLRLNRQAVKHSRLADGEIADIDHLLHFAFALSYDFSRSRA